MLEIDNRARVSGPVEDEIFTVTFVSESGGSGKGFYAAYSVIELSVDPSGAVLDTVPDLSRDSSLEGTVPLDCPVLL